MSDGIKAGRAKFAVMIFDLNGLKGINDQLGHEQGYRDVFKRADNATYEDKKAFYQTHKDRRKR